MNVSKVALKLGASAVVFMSFTALIIVVFGQMRFDRTSGYTAEFANASGIRAGQFVRAYGVEVGKVSGVRLAPDGRTILVDFDVDRTLPLDQSVSAKIRYADLIGNRYLELQRDGANGSATVLPPGGTIPLSRTQPALDLDALIGGFKPLFKSLDPAKVNNIARSLITVFQGQGGSINDILQQTGELTRTLAERDQAIGDVITNLNTVLRTTVDHQKDFDQTITNLHLLIGGLKQRAPELADGVADISTAADSLAELLAADRPLLHTTVERLDQIEQPLLRDVDQLDDLLTRLPNALQILSRSGGIYGDFFNFYLCNASVKLNGLQPGGPVRTVKLLGQPTGRCTPK